MKSKYGENDNENNVKILNIYLNIKHNHFQHFPLKCNYQEILRFEFQVLTHSF